MDWKKKKRKKVSKEKVSEAPRGVGKVLGLVTRRRPKRFFARRCPSKVVKRRQLIATNQEQWLYGRFGAYKSQQTC